MVQLLPPPDAPKMLEAVWVHRPTPSPPAVQKAAPPPQPVPKLPSKTRPRPTSQPITAPEIAPTLPVMALPVPEEPVAVAADLSAAAPALPDPAAMAEHTPTGPQLQIQDASGSEVALLLPTDGSALAQHQLLRFQVTGFVKGMQYHAHAELEWRTEGQHYQARQYIGAFLLGSMEQTSQGQLTPQGLQPLEFTDRRFAKKRAVSFDWDTHQAAFTPARPATPIGTGAQDRLSVFLQLAAILHSTPSLRVAGTRIQIPTLGTRRMQLWTFQVQAVETLDLPTGATPTLRLQRLSQSGEDQEQALLWLDATQGYVPVRIHMEESNGDVMDFVLKD